MGGGGGGGGARRGGGGGRRATPQRAATLRPRALGTLYDVPVSNNGARCRLLARWLGLYDDLVLTNPNDAFADGGIKSAAYAEINPQLKMPTLVAANGLCVPESEVINAYLMDAASEGARRLATPKTIEGRTNGALATRTHDQYLVPIQGAMYRGPMDRATRATQLAEIARQLRILDEICGREDGDYVAGETKSAADAALFPTLIFCDFLLPKYFGWSEGAALGGANLRRMYEAVKRDPDGAKTYDEVRGGLEAWESAGRFEKVGIVDDVADVSFQWSF